MPADFKGYGRDTIKPRDRSHLFRAVFDAADVANLNGSTVDVCDHQLFHVPRIGITAERAQDQFTLVRFDIAAGHVRILALQRVTDFGNRNLVGGQSFGIDPDIDRAIEPADDIDLADAARAFQLHLDDLIGVFGQFTNRPLARECNRDYRSAVVIKFRDNRRLGIRRQIADNCSDTIAHVLRRGIDVAVEIEGREHDRTSLHRHRAQVVDTIDGVNDFFDLLRDERLHLFRRRARKLGAHADGGQIDGRKAIHAELEIARRTDHDQRQDDHRGEDRTADTDFS